MTKTLIRKRVKRGIKWLDKTKPGWMKKIVFKRLRMAGDKTCICGQVFGDWRKVRTNLSIWECAELGFNPHIDGKEDEWDTLEEVWKEEIRKHRKK